ncbi:TetM/TetW/TetO/TetS family tetracycline resistance ribosomal protection protein [Paenibacillus sp.]|uniref:TetM/TetW/TetO/TetS family tetracycline resistance ribosomal protection protein n=1 Tax=Paenibacillus sp. TaxID=58172 RepID=UPI00281109B1|nr:TetM/TetW/TetO/TetS family tetracycline resistance ribosomal protection protein [Paenibacillus sp.]
MNATPPSPSRRNVGIFAHVDAGKTTTTEHLLYESGRIRALGDVDRGTASTDWLDVERERGISVRAATTMFQWNGVSVNVVDTPGHVDFLSEVERSLRVMDGAVLVLSAVEGVQAQTEVIWHALRKLGIPTILYVNKMDRAGADAARVLNDIHKHLSPLATPVQQPIGAAETFDGARDLWNAAEREPGAIASRTELIESVAQTSESLMERYFEEGVPDADAGLASWRTAFRSLARRSALFPVLFGASSKGIGIRELMEAIALYLPEPGGDASAPVSGVVFKIERDKTMGRMAYVRLYQGTLRNRDPVRNLTLGADEKVTQIRKVDGQKSEDVGVLTAGDIAAVCGLQQARIGDVLGTGDGVPEEAKLAVPLLTVQVHWANEHDYPRVIAALHELADEDPLLSLQWLQEERELHLKVMGPIQLEILSRLLESRFGLAVTFGQPSVIYKETLRGAGEGFVAYTMPKPCWAILRFQMEPLPRGAGLRYDAQVRAEDLLPQYQNEVARRVPEALQQGLYGWEVVDVRITLVEGQHHVWHTHPLDFVVATPMGIMDGLNRIGTKLLEPMLRFRLTVPEEFGGKVMNDLVLMRATFEAPEPHGDRMTIHGRVPVATSLEYAVKLGSMTKGRAALSTFFDGYEECPPDVWAERPRRGVNPLDTAKYILSVRNALSSS